MGMVPVALVDAFALLALQSWRGGEGFAAAGLLVAGVISDGL
jgi:hypothetical protein